MSKRIELDELYWLEADGYNWTLRYEYKRMEEDELGIPKEVTSSDVSFHGTLQFALKAYCDKSLKKSASVQELLNNIQKLHDCIEYNVAKIKAESKGPAVKIVDKSSAEWRAMNINDEQLTKSIREFNEQQNQKSENSDVVEVDDLL